MKKIRNILPFLAVFVLLFGSVALSRLIHTKPENFYHVNTAPGKNGEIHTIQLFDSISSVMIIDFDNHSKKKQLPREEYEYDKSTARLMLKNPLPFKNPVIHIEGIASQPETFFLHDFERVEGQNQIFMRDWETNGTYYRLTGEVEKKDEIERFLEKH